MLFQKKHEKLVAVGWSKAIKIFYINLKGRASDSINFIYWTIKGLNANHKCTNTLYECEKKKQIKN